jgi:hypothetical protein
MTKVPGTPFWTPVRKDPLAYAQWMPPDRQKQFMRRWYEQGEHDGANEEEDRRRHLEEGETDQS